MTATHSASDDVLIEMSALGVSKGAALAHQASRLGLPLSAVAAVGDMPNDVPMLVEAGLGLAVETGHPAARAAADALLPGPAGRRPRPAGRGRARARAAVTER